MRPDHRVAAEKQEVGCEPSQRFLAAHAARPWLVPTALQELVRVQLVEGQAVPALMV